VGLRLVQSLFIALPLVFATACQRFPKDPNRTLDHIREHGEIRVGVAEDPPFIIRKGDDASGIEAGIIRGFAAEQHANVHWIWGAQEKHFHDLGKFQLDLVAGGVTAKSPWSKKVAMTRPYAQTIDKEKHTLAAPPGENAFLLELEKYLAAHHSDFAYATGDTK
jgi:polar amino acid transport system substrate-binding protein